ncbi:putative late blight resistance protein homolog R1A-3 [Andrographis paniculata]|uniref:putative late blight resistance protein homolog R1A-3 n=1 Tax=Andrographis paniculata TaxID=175694 RepID=UPI0021E771B0|nr:putative late blight resistance protein homolog R1A-3 [Andrographis paniculata]
MAVAAYASLVSLTHVLDNIHYRAQLRRLHVDITRIEFLQESINFLVEFLELNHGRKGQEIEDLWRQISEASFELEETFDLHVVSQLQKESPGENSDMGGRAFDEDLDTMIQKFDYIKRELSMVEEAVEEFMVEKQTRASVPAVGSSTAASSIAKNTIVGLGEHVANIKGELARYDGNLQIIPIVGMGGIGKTTLAKKVYEDKYVVERFVVRIWLTISQEYSVNEILLGLINEGKVERHGGNSDVPGEVLRKKLYGRRYLIVMDDIWTLQAWDDLRRFFPNNRNGSRIILTTRLSHVAGSLSSHDPYSMTLMDMNTSWSLFCQTVFGEENCSHRELEQIGRRIVRNCRGLPLQITVIGGLLAKSGMKKEYWESVAKNVSSFGNASDGEHCFNILLLSYNNLPIYLKPCFLYMRAFPEDAEIEVSNLIRLWVDEGYITIKEDKILEEQGEEYLKDLVDRNLLFVREQNEVTGELETCGIHDLLRDLCISVSTKVNFFCSPRIQNISLKSDRRLCFLCGGLVKEEDEWGNLFALNVIPPSASSSNPPVCGKCEVTYSHIKTLRFVKVIDEVGVAHDSLMQHTRLRYVSVTLNKTLMFITPSMLHLLWNLQSLFFQDSPLVVLPSEIWELPQLRTIDFKDVVFPKPPNSHVGEKDAFTLKNLQSLGSARNFELTDEILDGIPNLKELVIKYDKRLRGLDTSLCYLARLPKLETLIVQNTLQNIGFPNSLKLLVLKRCRIPWSGMSIVGSLPNLEKLILMYTAEGSEWNPTEGEFLRLKALMIHGSDVVQWGADQNHYPVLKILSLSNLPSLEEIPLGVGDIPTLREINLSNCSKSAADSAYLILEEQLSMGNDNLKIEVYEYSEDEDDESESEDEDEGEDTVKDQDQDDDSEGEDKEKDEDQDEDDEST